MMESNPTVIVSFRGRRVEFDLRPDLTVDCVRHRLVAAATPPPAGEVGVGPAPVATADVKLLHRGKALDDGAAPLAQILGPSKRKVHKMMAVGRSADEAREIRAADAAARDRAPRVRDDLTAAGRRAAEERRALGRRALGEASRREVRRAGPADDSFGFGRIETLPNLPDEARARAMLDELANDPGIMACMKKRGWRVGSLAELYPEGKVGESAVCVMGLNKNKGQQILLRLRTDDLKGFRKMLSVRRVLYHELAHNVHSAHDTKFFQLMREVERECTELDWTRGGGISAPGTGPAAASSHSGGTFRLGGAAGGDLSARDLRAKAALSRMTAAEEQEIEMHCGCGDNKFLPPGVPPLTTGADARRGGGRGNGPGLSDRGKRTK